MSAEQDIYASLAADAGVTALVGSRIKPDTLAADSLLPAIVYLRADTETEDTLDGSASIGRAIIEVWCNAETRPVANAVAAACRVPILADGFALLGRRNEFDPETQICSTVLSVEVWEL